LDPLMPWGAKGVWLQVGITNREGIERAREAGLVATRTHCTMVVHRDELG
jgi:predicted CoA-binding protein